MIRDRNLKNRVYNLNHEIELIFSPGLRLDTFLFQNLEDKFSRTFLQKMIKKGQVSINSEIIVKPSATVKTASLLKIQITEQPSFSLEPSQIKIPVIFQDEHLAILHKPAYMTVHPGAGTGNDTLVHSLMGQFESLAPTNDITRPGIVHRLDRETEGLMIIALSASALEKLSLMFAERSIAKTYLAWAWGSHLPEKAKISGFIHRNPRNRKLMEFTEIENSTGRQKKASLSYETLLNVNGFAKLKIQLETGRTHQIRATFLAKNAPIVGDKLYIRKINKTSNTEPIRGLKNEHHGLLLLSQSLEFIHPITGNPMKFSLEEPQRFKDFEDLVSKLNPQ